MEGLNPINKESVVDVATTNLRRVVLDGAFKVGDKLPAERALAETLGVHRATLRCALARLEAEGLVKARHGSGYVVLDFLKTGTTALIGPLVARPASAEDQRRHAQDLLLLRRHLAAALFENLQQQKPPPDAFAAVQSAIDGLRAVDDEAPVEVFARADLDVVATLVDVANSPVLSLCLHPISSVLLSWPALMVAMYRERSANADRWQAIVEWLSSSEPVLSLSDVSQLLAEFDIQTLSSLVVRSNLTT